MKLSVFFSLVFILITAFVHGKKPAQGFDRSVFYAAMASDKLDEINAQLNIVKASSIAEKTAYEGALLMKKAGLARTTKEKLNLFKSGRSKLESSISKDNANVEYRFLRVIIQEHAPKIVKYRNQLEEDSRLIQANFKDLPQYLQQVINDYSKKSKILKTS